MRYHEIITEGRDAPLFHATDAESAELIIVSNKMMARTIHADIRNTDRIVSGVSLTRNLRFAYEWEDVVFEFDQTKLAQTFKIFPYHYYSNPKDGRSSKSEYEEFVVGDITRLKRYLIRIRMKQSTFDELSEESLDNILLTHPLLYVEKSPSTPRYRTQPTPNQNY